MSGSTLYPWKAMCRNAPIFAPPMNSYISECQQPRGGDPEEVDEEVEVREDEGHPFVATMPRDKEKFAKASARSNRLSSTCISCTCNAPPMTRLTSDALRVTRGS